MRYPGVIDRAWGQDRSDIGEVFLTETKLRSIKTLKQTKPIFGHLHGIHLVYKGFNRWSKQGIFFLEGQTREIPCAILPARVANQKAGFVSFCPLTDSTIQLKRVRLLLSTIYQCL